MKNWKKHLKISSFYTSVPKIMITCSTVSEIWCVTNLICIFPFGLFLPFNPTNSLKNQNLKKWKKGLDISSFYKCVPKIMITWCTVPEIWCTMDRQKKWPGVDTEKKSWHWECGRHPNYRSIQHAQRSRLGGRRGWGAGKYSAGLWQSQGFYRWNKHNVLRLFSVPIIREWIVKTFNYKDSFKGAV